MKEIFICVIIFVIFIISIIWYHVGYAIGFKKCREIDDNIIDEKIKKLKG